MYSRYPMKKRTYTILVIGAVALSTASFLSSCVKENPDSPGFEYFPDMYRSPAPETNLAYVSEYSTDSMGNRLPAEGTIPRGFTVFPYPNSVQGDSLASKFWVMPIDRNDKTEEEGQALYDVYCKHCHGAKGDGNGKLVETGKYAAVPPSYIKRHEEGALTDGHVYHVITYGKGNMGSHALFLTPTERWKVIQYVQRLGRGGSSWSEYQKKLAEQKTAPADSTKAAEPKQEGTK
ncbi:MAG: hypothetical protein Fur0041_10480 [Bacteroidia bacterium]